MRLQRICFSLIFFFGIAVSARADVPVYTNFQLQARANLIGNPGGSFNLPPGASVNSITVQVNDAGGIAFLVGVLPPPNSAQMGLWEGGTGIGSIVYMGEDDAFFSNPTLNSSNNIAWEQSFSSQNGLWVYRPIIMSAARETTLPLGASSWGSPTINNANQIGYRVNFAGNGQAWYSYTPTPSPSATLHVADVGVMPGSPYSFIFTPAFNNNRQIAGKLRLGGPGQTGNSQPDQIRIFNVDGSSVLIAEDRDGNPASPYTAFDNSVALTDDSRVAFVANLFGGGRGVYLSNGTTTIEIANTNTSVANSIESFPPAVNEKGWVAFRAFENTGLRAIWLGDGTILRRVVREHDLIASDLGTVRIDQETPSSPVFGGSITINECGDIAFNAGLTPPDNDQIEYGTGMYLALAPRATKGDMNCDCVVGLSDLDHFVQALIDPSGYTATHPNCSVANADMNLDTSVDGADVAGFVDLLTP